MSSKKRISDETASGKAQLVHDDAYLVQEFLKKKKSLLLKNV